MREQDTVILTPRFLVKPDTRTDGIYWVRDLKTSRDYRVVDGQITNYSTEVPINRVGRLGKLILRAISESQN